MSLFTLFLILAVIWVLTICGVMGLPRRKRPNIKKFNY
jgi:hypothetical protein